MKNDNHSLTDKKISGRLCFIRDSYDCSLTSASSVWCDCTILRLMKAYHHDDSPLLWAGEFIGEWSDICSECNLAPTCQDKNLFNFPKYESEIRKGCNTIREPPLPPTEH